MRITYDRETCSRCGGSGRMPFSTYGGVCFKCNGKGDYLTRQGRKAAGWFAEWAKAHLSVAASQLQPGDRVLHHGAAWTVVERTTTLGHGGGTSRIGTPGTDGFTETWTYGRSVVTLQRGNRTEGYQTAAHAPLTRAWTNDTLRAAATECRLRKGYTVEEEQ